MPSSSILTSVKKNLGLNSDMKEFDPDIIMAINTSLNILVQLGIGPEDGFQIEDESSTWKDFVSEHTRQKRLNMVKTYVYSKTRLIFDPPQLSSVRECMNEIVKETEFRLQCEVDPEYMKEGDQNGDDDCSGTE